MSSNRGGVLVGDIGGVGDGTMTRLSLIAVIALLGASQALAADKPQRVELTPFVGFRVGGKWDDLDSGQRYEIKESPSYGLTFNWNLDPGRQIEFLYSVQKTDVTPAEAFNGQSKIDLDYHYFQGGGVLVWGDDKWKPYLSVTVGIAYVDPKSADLDTETKFAGSIGGGVRYYFSDHVGLRFEGRGYGTFFESDGAIFCSGGCVVNIESTLLLQLEAQVGLIIRF